MSNILVECAASLNRDVLGVILQWYKVKLDNETRDWWIENMKQKNRDRKFWTSEETRQHDYLFHAIRKIDNLAWIPSLVKKVSASAKGKGWSFRRALMRLDRNALAYFMCTEMEEADKQKCDCTLCTPK